MNQNATSERPSLTPRQQKVIGALLTEPTLEAAAQCAGVCRATLWRWLQDERFSKAYHQVRRESVRQAVARLQQASSEAVDTLRDVMQCATAHPAAKVSAAKAVLEFSLKAIELEDLALRIEQLETLLQSEGDSANKGRQTGR
jgi:hypothetical protein